MANTSNAAADKGELKTGPEKVSEKIAEKRRALGRGLESLLPGPRVVSAPPAPAAAVEPPARNLRDVEQAVPDSVPAVRPSGSASPASGASGPTSGPTSVPMRPTPVAATGPTSIPTSPVATAPEAVRPTTSSSISSSPATSSSIASSSVTSSASSSSVAVPSSLGGSAAGSVAAPPRLAPKEGANLGHPPVVGHSAALGNPADLGHPPARRPAPVNLPAEEWGAEPAPEGSAAARVLALVEEEADEKSGDGEKVPGVIAMLQAVASDGPAKVTGELKLELPIELIDRNPHQTRRDFNHEVLGELAASIYTQGVLQPIVVRPGKEGRFLLVLGERRLRASKMAKRTTIPAIVKRLSDQQAAEMTLVENLQREDLDCLEQAAAFANLSQNFKLTQSEIALRVGASRETVANYMRILTLPVPILRGLIKGPLTFSHARALMQLDGTEEEMEKVAEKAVKEKLSVWALEDLIANMNHEKLRWPSDAPVKRGARWVDPNVKAAQRSIQNVLGMKVRIRDRKGKGKITIEYGSLEDFDRVVTMLKGKVRS